MGDAMQKSNISGIFKTLKDGENTLLCLPFSPLSDESDALCMSSGLQFDTCKDGLCSGIYKTAEEMKTGEVTPVKFFSVYDQAKSTMEFCLRIGAEKNAAGEEVGDKVVCYPEFSDPCNIKEGSC